MEEKPREAGIYILDDVPWGTHLCQFYKTRKDLIDFLVPYFKAGLENNEYCMWITSEPLNEMEAKKAIRKAVPNFDRYLRKRQIEIIPYDEWYIKDGSFDLHRTLDAWIMKLDQARAQDYDGLRVASNTSWLEEIDWRDFTDHEEQLNKVIGKYRMLAICTYALDKCGPNEVIDVVGNHQFTIIRRSGKWKLIEGYERKQADEAMRGSEEKYRTLVESTKDSIYVVDKDCRYIYTNNKNLSRIGVPSEQVIGNSYHNFHSREEAEKFKERINQVFKTCKSLTHEHKSDRDGKYFLQTYSPIIGADRRPDAVTVVSKEISSLKKTEEKLRDSEKLFKGLVEKAGIAILIDDREGNVKYSNKKFSEMFGYSKKEINKLSIQDIVHPDDVIKVMSIHKKRIKGNKVPTRYEFKGIRKDGPIIYLEVNAVTLDDGKNVIGTRSYFWDITERKMTEEALKESERSLAEAQRIAHLGSWEFDIVNNKLWWSNEVYRIFGLKPQEIEATYETFLENIHPDDRGMVNKAYADSLKNKTQYDIIHRLKSRDGTIKFVNERCKTFYDDNDEPFRSIGTVQDITEHKQVEEELEMHRSHLEQMVEERTRELEDSKAVALSVMQDANNQRQRAEQAVVELEKFQDELEKAKEAAETANRAKSDFLANMSHELRTPLNSILGFSEILIDQTAGKLNDQQKEFTEFILNSGRHLLDLINDILDLSKVEAGKMKLKLTKVPIWDYLGNSLVMIREKAMKHDISLDLAVPDEIKDLEIEADERKFKQIMFNLLSNAVKFTPDGGEITVKARREKEKILIGVSDTGIGIKPEDQERIFDEFEQADSTLAKKQQGTGLGLTLTKKLVELHKGRIWVESEGEGKGSNFQFEIPLKCPKR